MAVYVSRVAWSRGGYVMVLKVRDAAKVEGKCFIEGIHVPESDPHIQTSQTRRNPTADHSKCMALLQEAGIYVIQDLSKPSNSINREDPSWTTELFAGYVAVIDEMASYTNTLGFFAGNEVSNKVNNTNASAYVKAAVRDSKAYIKTKGYRDIGVGYAANDDAEIRDDLKDFFNCGKTEEAIDFFGYNVYSWCGKSTYVDSGFDKRTEEFTNYTVPVFFAEYGCNTVAQRPFDEVQAIYGPKMTDVWSGGIAYMYFQEENNYGFVTIKDDSVTKLPEFTALSSQIAKITPKGTASSAYVVSNTVARSCPTIGANWAASSNLPPIANSKLCECMVSSLSCKAKDGIKPTDIADQFDYVCGEDPAACGGINGNATTGKYGAYSMCTAEEKLSFVYNQYYLHQDEASTACDFDGTAETQSGSTDGDCSALVSAAGTAGAGTVTDVPTGVGSGSKPSSAASSSAAAMGSVIIPRFEAGLLSLGAYLMVAAMAGAGMVLL
ncbi:hypothetical protein V500_04712 [Pseudogymnoascus sp. VKM F-4518 (FW-2643)]|nr:hypothetical protein V500_04712 [Pseudogymnoascus sp. VKM F-4518 (FW-2643)]